MATRRRRVVWTEQARRMLDDALAYIAQDSRPTAERLLIQALEAASSLDVMSERGRVVPEFAQPAHVGALKRDPVLGLLDSPENILANKLTAVVDRSEPKDLADIWGFCCRMGLSCEAALEGAQSKAAGLFPADVARVLLSVTKDDWQLVRWSDPPECTRFIDDLRALGERLLLLH
jgi:plasmid stabilization system protein ParE